jgi:hypothetical protein
MRHRADAAARSPVGRVGFLVGDRKTRDQTNDGDQEQRPKPFAPRDRYAERPTKSTGQRRSDRLARATRLFVLEQRAKAGQIAPRAHPSVRFPAPRWSAHDPMGGLCLCLQYRCAYHAIHGLSALDHDRTCRNAGDRAWSHARPTGMEARCLSVRRQHLGAPSQRPPALAAPARLGRSVLATGIGHSRRA